MPQNADPTSIPLNSTATSNDRSRTSFPDNPPRRRDTLACIFDLRFADLKELGRGIGRNREHALHRLNETIDGTRLQNIGRLIDVKDIQH